MKSGTTVNGRAAKRLCALAATALLAATPALLSPSTASANTTFDYGGTRSGSTITSYAYLKKPNTGFQVRASQECTTASGQTEFTVYGPWVSYGKTSRTASCPYSRYRGSGIAVRKA